MLPLLTTLLVITSCTVSTALGQRPQLATRSARDVDYIDTFLYRRTPGKQPGPLKRTQSIRPGAGLGRPGRLQRTDGWTVFSGAPGVHNAGTSKKTNRPSAAKAAAKAGLGKEHSPHRVFNDNSPLPPPSPFSNAGPETPSQAQKQAGRSQPMDWSPSSHSSSESEGKMPPSRKSSGTSSGGKPPLAPPGFSSMASTLANQMGGVNLKE